jgi:hypothetical protein
MTFTLSRILSTATATYAGYCFVDPRHLGRAVTGNPVKQADLDVLAHTFGARDFAVSSLAIFGRSPKTITSAMLLRIVLDVSDGLVLAAETDSDEARNRVLGVTFGWAALNTLALVIDRRRARKGQPITV